MDNDELDRLLAQYQPTLEASNCWDFAIKYGAWMRRYAYRVGGREWCEVLYTRALIRLPKFYAAFREGGGLHHFIKRCVAREMRRKYNKLHHWVDLQKQRRPLPKNIDGVFSDFSLPERKEGLDILRERLSEFDYTLLVSRYAYGMSVNQIGEQLGLSKMQASNLIHNALKRARQIFGVHGDG